MIRRRCGATLADFFRRLRGAVGEPFPYLWVPEWHTGGHGLHVHFAVGRFIATGRIDAAWGRGFVHIKLLGDLPVGSGTLGEARRPRGTCRSTSARTSAPAAAGGLHRYEVAQGFQPRGIDSRRDGRQGARLGRGVHGRPPSGVALAR